MIRIRYQPHEKSASKAIRCFASLCGAVFVVATLTGCTVLFGAAGAAVDTIVVTMPLWGPSAVNANKQKKARTDVAVAHHPGTEVYLRRTNTDVPFSPILVRPLEGPQFTPTEKQNLFPKRTLLPFVPCARRTLRLDNARQAALPTFYEAYPYDGNITVPVELARIPESLRTSLDIGRPALIHEAVLEIAGGDLASHSPSQSNLNLAYCLFQERSLLFALTAAAQETLDRSLPTQPVIVQLPEISGYMRRPTAASSVARNFPPLLGRGGARTEQTVHEPPVGASGSDSAAGTHPSVDRDGDRFLVRFPPGSYTVRGHARGYAQPAADQIVVTGRVLALDLEATNLTYGVTVLGANLLSYFGVPLSTNRLTMTVELKAWRGEAVSPFLERTATLATPRRVVGLYYGGEFVRKQNDELGVQFDAFVAAFAESLRPSLVSPGFVAGATRLAVHGDL